MRSRTLLGLFPALLLALAAGLVAASAAGAGASSDQDGPIVEVAIAVAADGPDQWIATLLVDSRVADPVTVAREYAPGGVVIDQADGRAEAAYVRWATWDRSAIPVSFLYNGANAAASGDLLKAVQFAMQQWNGAGGHFFKVVQSGTTQARPAACDGVPDRDGLNVVGWRNDLPKGVLGSTCAAIRNLPSGRQPVEADIAMASNVDWSDTAVTPPGTLDLWSTVLHEFGHVVGLDHSLEAGSVMAAKIAPGQQTRILSADDLAGIRALYPDASALPSPSPSPTPSPTPRPVMPFRLQLAGPIAREP